MKCVPALAGFFSSRGSDVDGYFHGGDYTILFTISGFALFFEYVEFN